MVKHYLHKLSAPFSLRRVLLAAMLLLIGSTASAYDFAVKNADGVKIYYNILGDGSVAVTYGSSVMHWTGTYSGKVNIPSSITIGGSSYSVTSIYTAAFYDCDELTEVTIPESVTSIGGEAFYNCSGLTEVTIPESVTSIGGEAFYNCSGLTEVNFNATNCTEWGSEDYKGYHNVFVSCINLQKLTIGDNVQTIPSRAFLGIDGLTEVTIPNSVTSIGDYAFENCDGLTEVTIPKSVTSIGGRAFACCDGLTSIIVDSNNPVYDSRENCNSIIESPSNTLISGCMNSKIPNSVTSIGESAFFGCDGLTEITIPNSVTSIGDYAFENCDGLTEVTIPESVTSIGDYAFENCDGLTEVNFNATNCTHMGYYPDHVFDGCNNLQKLTIGNNVQTIPNYAFYGCTGLTEITIPESVTYIGSYAFYNSVIGQNRGYTEETKSTQTTISTTIKITNPSAWNCNKKFYLKYGEKYELNGEEITIDGLIPGKHYQCDICIAINGCETTFLCYDSFLTKDVTISGEALKTATSVMLTPNVDAGDAVVANQYVSDGSNILPTYITGLDPNTTYTFNYVVEGERWTRKKEFTVKTDELTMLTLPGQAMNTTTALLCAETNICDDEVNVGFEWRRHDAPSTLPSNKVACAAIDGTITGALSGLNPEVYYNYRPYYTSNSGKTYYGEWITFFTGDANVFFDPTVKTYSAEVLDDYSAVLKGYALRGSEEIASQGFQYWKSWGAPNGSRSNEVAEVEVKGQKLSCTIADLEPGSTYTYRTFVKTASGITYGEEMTFDTPGSAGIEETIAETTEVVITGYYNLQGVRSDRPFSGLNIVSYSDGTTKKVIYRK
ncbi:MAG: leucine-rich repeat domain-containing protein [Bacteroidales bacterium]|nr:leucine-rich repeat domain-containing protein [Bacteroidales bacterium]